MPSRRRASAASLISRDQRVVEQAAAAQEALVAAQALARLRLLDPGLVDVDARVVGGRVRRGAVGDGLDERRPLPRPGPRDGLAGGQVDGQDVGAVDPDPRHPVARGLVDQGPRPGLLGERRRDRPAVVVAEQDERRLHHGGEVRALVERALGGRPVAEEGDRAGALALEPLAPGEARGVRDVGRDRDADRGDPVLGGVPPAVRVPAPPGEHRRDRDPAQKADRRLAVGREDPVALVEGRSGADLHRLVAPVDRVGADPALAVVHHGALVVGAQQDQVAVQPEQRRVVELDALVGGVVVADHAAQRRLGDGRVGHEGSSNGRLHRPKCKCVSLWSSRNVSCAILMGVTDATLLRLDAPREDVLARASRLVADAWTSFDQARPGQPPIAPELARLLALPLPEHGTGVLEALDEAGPGARPEPRPDPAAVVRVHRLVGARGRRRRRPAGGLLRREPGRRRGRRERGRAPGARVARPPSSATRSPPAPAPAAGCSRT